MENISLPLIVIRGAGDLASGVAMRLYKSGLRKILFLETEHPLAVRRTVAFSEAVHAGTMCVEGIHAVHVKDIHELEKHWEQGHIPLLIDTQGHCLEALQADVVVDAILAKKNLGTHKGMASLVIGLGPGFSAGHDVHAVIETMRGHYLSRVIYDGCALPNTGAPAPVQGYSVERVFWAHEAGTFYTERSIGDLVEKGDTLGYLEGPSGKHVFKAVFAGVIRGLLRTETPVKMRTKLGDVDPRADIKYIDEVSDKGLAIGGGVLEAIMAFMVKSR